MISRRLLRQFFKSPSRIFLLIFLIVSIVFTIQLLKQFKPRINKNENEEKRNQTLFCMILTTPKGFDSLRPQTTYNIWAHKCDNTKFISLSPESLNKTRNSSNKHDLEYLVMQPENFNDDAYHKLSAKVFLAIKQIYKDFGGYDWYLKADDDTYIQIDNLREFLKDKNPNKPVTYGYDFKVIVEKGYHSGGAGYLLSHEAFDRIGSALHTEPTFCKDSGIEDVDVAACLRRLDVFSEKSIDELGRERFVPLNLPGFYSGWVPGWLLDYAANPYRNGSNCCSDSFISFHYMTPTYMRILDSCVKRLTFLLNQNNTSGKLIRPKFVDVAELFMKFEKLESEMIGFWERISRAMTTTTTTTTTTTKTTTVTTTTTTKNSANTTTTIIKTTTTTTKVK